MKVFIIGLDGASLDLLMPWIHAGFLPGFSRLLEEGSHSALESVPNQRSAAAWTSFQTGKNPGKHGILEFYERIPNTYDIRFINAKDRDGSSFFRIASDAGRCVVAINVPMTYPAEEVNGAMIAGLDAPGTRSKGFSYPPELISELESLAGEYIIEPGITGCIVNGEVDKAVRLLFEEIESKVRVTRFLMQKYAWDLFVTVFRSTDAVHHCFWKYLDERHPDFDPAESKRYGDVILRTYQRIDRFVQEILHGIERDTMLLVVSDHGCGPKHPASNQLNAWLEAHGFLAYERSETSSRIEITRLMADLYKWTIAKTPRRMKELLWRFLPGVRDRVQSRLCFSGIDWTRTRAFSDTLFPNIWINLLGREPQGIVIPGREYESLCDDLVRRLQVCQDANSGEPIVEKVFRRREIYAGPHVEDAPDLLVRWREDLPIHGLRIPVRPDSEGGTSSSREVKPFIPGEDYRVISGDHRLNGILLSRIEGQKTGGPLPGRASIVDIAATALYALGVPIPEDMDGQVLTSLFDDGFVVSHPVRYGKSERGGRRPAAEGEGYADEEVQRVRERLRSLGYLE